MSIFDCGQLIYILIVDNWCVFYIEQCLIASSCDWRNVWLSLPAGMPGRIDWLMVECKDFLQAMPSYDSCLLWLAGRRQRSGA